MRRKMAIAALVAATAGCGAGSPGGGSGGGSGGGGSACDLAAPTPLVGGVAAIGSIAVDGAFVYYVSDEGTHGVVVHRVPTTGGPPTALATLPAGSGSDLAVDDANVYFLESGSSTPGVHILAKTSGADRFVPTRRICGVARPLRLATFGGDVYWTQRDLATVDCDGGIELERLPPGSDAPVTLMAADEDSIGGILVDAATSSGAIRAASRATAATPPPPSASSRAPAAPSPATATRSTSRPVTASGPSPRRTSTTSSTRIRPLTSATSSPTRRTCGSPARTSSASNSPAAPPASSATRPPPAPSPSTSATSTTSTPTA